MLKVFLSYHHNARKFAGRVKSCLTGLGMDVFLAHEDLEPSTAPGCDEPTSRCQTGASM
jgi:hypothetical protein